MINLEDLEETLVKLKKLLLAYRSKFMIGLLNIFIKNKAKNKS